MLVSKTIKYWLITAFALLLTGQIHASSNTESSSEERFNPVDLIMHHVGDSHSWSIIHNDQFDLTLPLPIILVHDGRISVFSSSAFGHGEKIVNNGNYYYKLHHEKIYLTDEKGILQLNEQHLPTNQQPLDFSITRNVASMWLSIILLLTLFGISAQRYKHNMLSRPRGVQSFLEPIILFVRDDIAYKMIEPSKADRYLPFLLTMFFFIFINNLIGLIPFFPGGSNLTGNISLTLALALFTFIVTNINGTKSYWTHIFNPPGIPGWVKILIIPVEIIGLFTKPFALLIRLFANITAGHIIILCLISLIFIMKTIYFAPVSILLSVFMSTLELLVALLQAFIFTLLSALYIGMAVQQHEHHPESAH
ncbi:F-type H+-transporting ATPase subunit a [Breznakibacter xylanolyticus]|uniref:ATP synthase subunit a n=1 Tax=Breznakibacter xylanolyticus TaxID=990 RepID=A0A2W7N9M4_9BACT|nr:F0F1 ATP synthase subunit A [Breznakibacter xylanolyticus]PZX16758.1 F-type H+-transporting ATPase subunit a [Breznakibacter xylanolyticus]